ncbi:MAG TPA: alkaline phosphatase family protein [Povalibacter sp.]|nr:alkaline phosphatase family protein [Povalibacter sp.]
MNSNPKMLRPTLVAAAVASTLGLCSTGAFAAQSLVKGVVGGAYFAPPVFADTAAASAPASTAASVYRGAKVCFDLNDNGTCDAGEPSTMSGTDGSFTLSSRTIAPLVAEISTTALNNGHQLNSRNVFRVKQEQVVAATRSPLLPAAVDITPLSTEVARAVENDGVSYAEAVERLAQRLDVSPDDVLKAPTKITDSTELPFILKESVIDQGRFELAAKFVDRGDTVGVLRGNFDCPNVASFDPANASACPASDLQTVGIKAAQNHAMNLEGMPRYDYVFVIIEENESLVSLKNNASLPYLNALLNNGSQFYNYYSTGNPSEPNYLALGSADDWGITGDEPANLMYPAVTGVRANMSNAVDAKGLTWRHYEGSLWPSPAGDMSNPGQASWKTATGGAFFDNPANSSIVGIDGKTYTSGLVAKKHNTVSWFADVTAQPNFLSNERSISGTGNDVDGNPIAYQFPNNTSATPSNNWTAAGNWDAVLQAFADANHITAWWNNQPWNQDQFLADLKAGDVANYNIIVPDQQDDMHNIGTQPRADAWANNAIAKIQSSAIWKDPTKRVAIVVTFDEGESASTACCGWNTRRTGAGAAQPLSADANGTVSVTSGVSGVSAHDGTPYSVPYNNGNHGHGVTMFGVLTNQQVLNNAPHGHYDTDYYSHFSFVRTMQDILGLADPGQPGTYMNRSKYTENFIQQNATLLPEFLNSANPHFDAVRAMNHVYQFPAGVAHVVAAGAGTPPTTVGPDADQVNLWAVK